MFSFLNNFLVKIRNKQCENYRDKIEKYFLNKYDLNSIEGIKAVPIKEDNYGNYLGTTVNRIESVLANQGYKHEQNGDIELAKACFIKSNEIKYLFKGFYQIDAYLSHVNWLRRHKMFNDAKEEKERIKKLFPQMFRSGFLQYPFPDGISKETREDIELKNQRERDRPLYELLEEYLPEQCPKSFGAFRKMKNMNSANYKKIIEQAKEKGLKVDEILK